MLTGYRLKSISIELVLVYFSFFFFCKSKSYSFSTISPIIGRQNIFFLFRNSDILLCKQWASFFCVSGCFIHTKFHFKQNYAILSVYTCDAYMYHHLTIIIVCLRNRIVRVIQDFLRMRKINSLCDLQIEILLSNLYSRSHNIKTTWKGWNLMQIVKHTWIYSPYYTYEIKVSFPMNSLTDSIFVPYENVKELNLEMRCM